ncbi:alkene reductase [Demequina capsici]|uniref:Alkene reductase n=1 Tax=Demequina capsici TaxID=3075620 RepID=A0AA96JAE4_9MICO|nr:alkene reductase [Demequina sp. PMTSA13]WNM26893.1 alkene reductase [Demequina sp. PMTSA13]
MPDPFAPYVLGGVPLANRIVMAPMTRCRAGSGGTATELMARYYAQRADAGLIITEGIQPSEVGQGYPWTPGLHTAEQARSWRTVTEAVHARGGRIAAQLMHAGRISHPSVQRGGAVPVAPSAVRADGKVFTPAGMKDMVTPVALDEPGIRATIADFVAAARAAIGAGFDGVEIHGANGYLVHQFLAEGSNSRTDAWGGGVAGRLRFAVEVAAAVAGEIGPRRVGMRLSPGGGTSSDIHEDPEDLPATYVPLAHALSDVGLAWLHLVDTGGPALRLRIREAWHGALIVNPALGAGAEAAQAGLQAVEEGQADLVSYAALFLANPDLPTRLRRGGPFNAPDRSTYYGGDERGYTDYPELAS